MKRDYDAYWENEERGCQEATCICSGHPQDRDDAPMWADDDDARKELREQTWDCDE